MRKQNILVSLPFVVFSLSQLERTREEEGWTVIYVSQLGTKTFFLGEKEEKFGVLSAVSQCQKQDMLYTAREAFPSWNFCLV